MGDRWLINMCFLHFSIVIDSDKRHRYEHFNKKNQITMKIEPVTSIRMLEYAMDFEQPEKTKKWSFRLFTPNLPQLGLFRPYFVCKSSFRVISMIKIVSLEESKPISLILKNKNPKFKNPIFVNWTFIIHKNWDYTCIQPILKPNSTYFMFNNIFCEMNI